MILTIDVGLRNLSMCIMSTGNKTSMNTYRIHLWDTFNTLDSDDYTCQGTFKNGKICNRKCTYKYGSPVIHCCKTHFPKNITITASHHFKRKKIDEYLLQDIALVFIQRIQYIYDSNKELFTQLKSISIELQPKMNRKMVFTSHILYGKLVEFFQDRIPIRFVRASQKLKAYTGPELTCALKGAYARRKWLGIQYCIWFLEKRFSDEQMQLWLPLFQQHTKKDDLADVFLMAINVLHGISKKEKK
jgi:hypothetical protein